MIQERERSVVSGALPLIAGLVVLVGVPALAIYWQNPVFGGVTGVILLLDLFFLADCSSSIPIRERSFSCSGIMSGRFASPA